MYKRLIVKGVFLVFLAGILMSFFSCGNFRRALYMEQNKTKVWEADGVVMAVTFLDDKTVEKKYGYKYVNPFLTNYNGFMFRRIIPFEVKIINNSGREVVISTRDSRLLFDDKLTMTFNKFELEQFWETQDKTDEIDDHYHNDKIKTMLKYQVDTYEVIPSSSTFNKVLIFIGDTLDIGYAKVNIAILERNTKRIITRCEFDFDFVDPLFEN